ncbi:ABC transporter ATP-binding protein [Haematomicrobium sanguinis]|uniref:ABC transporter ATP-binding protein n=1 Tax=Haematomicrobium sanguinis TaxID=479106 RepID=UPI000949A1DB|nr:ATP-binding cassette domain-containing protein [Haematomicrobium sanguinis]
METADQHDPNAPAPNAMIEFRHVAKEYPDGTQAVRELNFDIERGKITVFVGPSGCGKTTTLRMINRMVDPTAGEVLVDGTNIATVNPPKLRRSMGYVMQAAGLMPHRTVVDNIATVPRLDGVPKAKARQRALELMHVVGLDESLAKRYPAQLSGGQQQRVGVARALAADPPLLLMDEPFSAVDPVVRAELQAETLRLQRELGKTVVFVTHDIDEAVLLGDKIAVFGRGEIEQIASPEELLRAPATNYVADFIGHDRGFRHLQFFAGSEAEIDPIDTVTVRDTVPGEGWYLVVDAQNKPLGWFSPQLNGPSQVSEDAIIPGGSLFYEGDSLRSALDSTLSSPAGLGVAVDGEGRVKGVLNGRQVLDAAGRAAGPQPPDNGPASTAREPEA